MAAKRKGVVKGTDANHQGCAFTVCREDGTILSQLTYGPHGSKEFYELKDMTAADQEGIDDFILSLLRRPVESGGR